mgnify:CR=1 FL=1|jgi:hypothetical protein
MSISRKDLCVVYLLIGLLGLVGTWGNNIDYFFSGLGIAGVNLLFWQETLANPASRSITVDILCLGIAAITWMFFEARRLSMRGIPIYVFLSIFVAIGAAFPFFMVHRERTLARLEVSDTAGRLSRAELAFLGALGLLIVGYTGLALTR